MPDWIIPVAVGAYMLIAMVFAVGATAWNIKEGLEGLASGLFWPIGLAYVALLPPDGKSCAMCKRPRLVPRCLDWIPIWPALPDGSHMRFGPWWHVLTHPKCAKAYYPMHVERWPNAPKDLRWRWWVPADPEGVKQPKRGEVQQ